MTTTLMIFQAVLSIFLIILVLLQFGKGAETGLFSATGDSVMTGPQKGNILARATIVVAFLFFSNSIVLAKLESKKSAKSILDNNSAPIARPLNSDALNTSGMGSGSGSGSNSGSGTAATTTK